MQSNSETTRSVVWNIHIRRAIVVATYVVSFAIPMANLYSTFGIAVCM